MYFIYKILEVDSSGDDDVVSDDEEETPPNLTNTKSDEDKMIQEVIREHNKIYPRKNRISIQDVHARAIVTPKNAVVCPRT